MRVKIVYRNYKHLHDLYASFQVKPPRDVSFVIPRPKRYLRLLLLLHRELGHAALVRWATVNLQETFFQTRGADVDVDLYHFIQLVPGDIPNKPYVVDFEHVIALADFSEIDQRVYQRIYRFLHDNQCCGIIPLTHAAHDTLKYLLRDDDYDGVANKVTVVHPALPNYHAMYSEDVDFSYVNPDPQAFRLLFVGSGVFRKGLHELLAAFRALQSTFGDIELYVVSNAPRQLTRRYTSDRIRFFEPKFSHHDIIRQFYLACDLFVLPTHSDSFGMALLYSLSCGTPVLTTKQFAAPEIIETGCNGLFVHSNRLVLDEIPLPNRKTGSQFEQERSVETDLVDELIVQIEYLYHNRDVLSRMGQQAVNDFEPGGKFSIELRNEKLKTIYESCCQTPNG
jgi:glycosyltransferase involved in cell wall biosynthesis